MPVGSTPVPLRLTTDSTEPKLASKQTQLERNGANRLQGRGSVILEGGVGSSPKGKNGHSTVRVMAPRSPWCGGKPWPGFLWESGPCCSLSAPFLRITHQASGRRRDQEQPRKRAWCDLSSKSAGSEAGAGGTQRPRAQCASAEPGRGVFKEQAALSAEGGQWGLLTWDSSAIPAGLKARHSSDMEIENRVCRPWGPRRGRVGRAGGGPAADESPGCGCSWPVGGTFP